MCSDRARDERKVMAQVLPVSEHVASNLGVVIVKQVVTYCAPDSAVFDFQSSRHPVSSNQSHCCTRWQLHTVSLSRAYQRTQDQDQDLYKLDSSSNIARAVVCLIYDWLSVCL